MNDNEIMNRRDFLKNLTLSAIGGSLLLSSITRNALGAFPWEERSDNVFLDENSGINISPMHFIGKGIKNEYPRVAITEDNRIWVVYVSERNNGEGIFLREFFPQGTWGGEVPISTGEGLEYLPQLIPDGNTLHIVWTGKRNGRFCVIHRSVVDGKPGEERIVSLKGSVNWKPCQTIDDKGALWIAWESKENDSFQIMSARIYKGQIEKSFPVATGDRDNCRPALCKAPDGTVWCAWDRYEGKGNFNVFIKPLNKTGASEIQVTHHPASNLAPSIAADKEGILWIAWHSNRKNEDSWDIPRWFYVRAYKDGQMFEPISPPVDKDLSKDGEDQSFEFVQVLCGKDGRIIITGRPSHNFCMQWYKGDKWSRLYRFPKDGWGGRGQYVKAAFDRNGDLWVTRRDLNANTLQSIKNMSGEYIKPVLAPYRPSLEIPALVGLEKKMQFPQWNGYNFYFGDIHAHTWMSDGVGDLDEFYIQHRDLLRDDFGVLTDHDTFVGNGMIPSEWEQQKIIASHFNEPDRFITLYGQEWTTARWPAKFGHKNIYHIDPGMPLLDHTDVESDTTDKIFAASKKLGALCIPHHIGWTGVDWENHDPVAQPLVEVVSGHGAFEYMGNKPIYHRGGKHGCFVQDGLARGLKFGFVGGSDTHGLIWHHRVGWKRNCLRTGLTCILAKDLTRNALFDAMKKRHTYATSGIKMRIVFEIAKAMMGEEISLSEPPKIIVNVMCPEDMKWIQIVKNNETIYTYGGEGYYSRFSYVDEKIEPGVSYYYLRVITEEGNMGWSSPIWVNYKKA